MRTLFVWITAGVLLLLAGMTFAEVDERGSYDARLKNWHSGNLVQTTFYNYGMIGREFTGVGDVGGGDYQVHTVPLAPRTYPRRAR